MRGVHICTFDVSGHLRGKALTYEALRACVLAAGRFSVFEATATRERARLFTRLCADAELELDRSMGYPWTGVRLRAR